MRTVTAVLVFAAACGDDGGQVMHDAAPVDMMIDVPADANLDLGGTWIDRYVSASGTATVAVCTSSPTAVIVDMTSAGLMSFPGACKADGSFRIVGPPMMLGTYYMRLGTSFYETNKRMGLDFSTDHLGRSDITAATGVTLNFSMTGMDAWAAGDGLYAFSTNVGYSQPLAFTTGAPSNGETTLVATAPWSGYKVESAKQDALAIAQLGAHTTGGGLAYTSLDRVFNAPPFTMANGATANVFGAFTTPTAATLQLRIDTASFNTFATVANPTVTTKTMDGALFASVSNDAKSPPSLLTFGVPTTGIASLDFGTLSYGDPYPAAWDRLVRVQAQFPVSYTYAAIASTRNATMTRVVTRATADANVIAAVLGPPTAPKFDGADAFTTTDISTVPL
ncbi:MAG TPA: hypothetical protein VL326_10080, partial [Kofleriaceae bacterium]|nr:hypothetical protein [Kofleriaceae bacterium]